MVDSVEVVGKDGEIMPKIYKKDLASESKTDKEVRILGSNGKWGLSTISEVRSGNRFRIYVVPATGFVAGYDNGYVITEYEATSDAYMNDSGVWGVDCCILEG